MFFLDVGLRRCQQMFADLNRNAIRPSKSLGVLYDHRDDIAQIRSWAESQGLDVSARGRIKKEIIEAYDAAHS